MKTMLVVAGLVISAISGYTQGQPDIAKLKADAENLVKITSGDKQKTLTYRFVSYKRGHFVSPPKR